MQLDIGHLAFRDLDREVLEEAAAKGEVLTGLLYVNTESPDFIELLNLVEEPLATLPQSRIRPSKAALDEVMEELR